MSSGQTVVEYILLIGIVTVAMTFMGTSLKRGVQSVVKVTADQIGNQQEADQIIKPRVPGKPEEGTSYLVNSLTNTTANVAKTVIESTVDKSTTTMVSENTTTSTDSNTDLGYTPPN